MAPPGGRYGFSSKKNRRKTSRIIYNLVVLRKENDLKRPLNKATKNPSENSELSHIPALRKRKISHPPPPPIK
jgi:hypothetical protein